MSTWRQVRFSAAKSGLRVPMVWIRHRGLKRNDVFVASYPRSGSTWLRFMLFEILTQKGAEFEDINRHIPDVGGQRDAVALLPNQGRLIKTHEPFRPDYKRAIYVFRDGRDVAFSEYAYHTAQGWIDYSFDEYLKMFVKGTASYYGSWQKHIRGWIDSPLNARGDLMPVSYLELMQKSEPTLTRIAEFLNVRVPAQVIQNAIRNNSIQNMRKKEDRAPQIPCDPRTKSIPEEKRFVRSGTVNGWRERLTPAQAEFLQRNTGKMLVRLGFEEDPSAVPASTVCAD
jgi:estrone sulfotransferase